MTIDEVIAEYPGIDYGKPLDSCVNTFDSKKKKNLVVQSVVRNAIQEETAKEVENSEAK